MTNKSSRNVHIDFLRGTAISCVLILHFSLAYGLDNSPLGTLLPTWFLDGLVENGNYGVTMFFTISGFLITSNSLARWGHLRNIDGLTFYTYRFARIMPPLVLALAIIVVLGSAGLPYFANTDGDHNLPASHFVVGAGSVLTFWHNVLMQSTGYFNYCLNIYWSLSVEEVFYLLVPLLCLSLRRTWLLALVCCLAIAVGPIYRQAHVDNEIYYMYGYLACFDAIAMGCLTALLAQRISLTRSTARAIRVGSLIALAIVYLRGIQGNEVVGFSIIALASAAFLFGANDASALKPLARTLFRPLRWLGRHSYEVYLFHIIVLALMRNLLSRDDVSYDTRLPLLCLFVALSVVVAALVARYVSEPANMAIRSRYFRRIGRAAITETLLPP
jgi:peptidoglycan/LPS O-acetylase OafA/YrhL